MIYISNIKVSLKIESKDIKNFKLQNFRYFFYYSKLIFF